MVNQHLLSSINDNNNSYNKNNDVQQEITSYNTLDDICHSNDNEHSSLVLLPIHSDTSIPYMNLNANSNANSSKHKHQEMDRHLTLFDLVTIGLGSTIGSGIFVLSGVVAKDMAGPGSALSWAMSGLAALFSGSCYAELAGRIPAEGSSYAYVYHTMGELPAVIAALCLTFEYLVASAAIARSWGDKLHDWIILSSGHEIAPSWWSTLLFQPPSMLTQFNTCAFLVSSGSIALLLKGVKESKHVTNVLTMVKVGVVLFMVIGGLTLFQPENIRPFIPPQYGFQGVMRGATTSFFGYLGFDEVCCLGGEAIDPKTNLPKAVMIVLLFVTTLYIVAAISLTGMQPYNEISSTTGYASAFIYNDQVWAANICAYGQLICLPVVSLITVMAQPRLQLAMAENGLFPSRFGEIDDSGNLTNGIMLCGSAMVLIASFVPFTVIDDTISSAVLVVYSMTDSSLLLLRLSSPDSSPRLLKKLILTFNGMCYVSGLLWVHVTSTFWGKCLAIVSTTFTVLGCFCIYATCPEGKCPAQELGHYRTPFLPFFPCVGIFINWYLVSQLSLIGNLILLGTMGITVTCYLLSRGSKNAFLSLSRDAMY